MSASEPTPSSAAAPQPQQTAASKSDFMAAGEIKGILHNRQKPEQERIMRWVNESLGLSVLPAGGGTYVTPSPPSPSATPTQQTDAHTIPPTATTRPSNIKMFVDEKKPKNDLQFTAVVAYYHRFESIEANRKETITAQDLQEATRLAARSRFKHPHTTLNNAVKQGYFDRFGRGEFKLNAVGENLVAMTLPGTGVATDVTNTGRRPKKRSRKPRKKAVGKSSAS